MTTTAWKLVNEAESKARHYAAGVATFGEAVGAYRAAERWLDEGPEEGDDLKDMGELCEVLASARRRLPEWVH
jgi:hypothetical protein